SADDSAGRTRREGASDIVAGILRTWLRYLNNSSIEKIKEDFEACGELESGNTVRFVGILENSLQENKAFQHWSGDLHTADKISCFFDLVSFKRKGI
ncbi:hypothetical protein ABZ595_37870, partial [Streptomyces rubradiris]|uniref:hypothetical protein n=1 Tax=Streptomyces rubradiris TaxID=285531 RepID=UPI0033ED49BF